MLRNVSFLKVKLVILSISLFAYMQVSFAANSSITSQQPLPAKEVEQHINNALSAVDEKLQQAIIKQLLEESKSVEQVLNFDNLPKQNISVNALPAMDVSTEEKIQADLAKLLKNIDKPGNEADLSQYDVAQQHDTSGLLVLVSFSMPDELIKQLGKEVAKAKGSLVLKGLIDNNFKATFARLTKLADGRNLPFILDPITFARFEAETVPTFVVAKGLETCQADKPCTDLKYSKLTGAVSLDYALNTIQQASKYEDVRSLASSYLATYEGGKQ